MKTAIMDVGSNSVRMIVFDGDRAIFRGKINSRLGEKISERKTLYPEAVSRTLLAVSALKKKAEEKGVEKNGIFAFATAAVRQAADGRDFLSLVKELYGVETELISGETEAEIGLNGALGGGDGAVLDIGGASSELAIREGGVTKYEKSLGIGAGVLTDAYFFDRSGLEEHIEKTIKGYGRLPHIENLFAIGGTASACAFIEKRLKEYDFDGVNGTRLTAESVDGIAEELFSLDVKGRMERFYLDENRATVLPYGAKLLAKIIAYVGAENVFVSERGNIEGYLALLKERKIAE